MSLELFLSIVATVGVLVAGYWALGKLLIGSYEKRLDERFAAQDEARKEGRRIWDERFKRIEERLEANELDITALVRDLPTNYVRREDAIRENTTINAKLDALNARLENLLTQRGRI